MEPIFISGTNKNPTVKFDYSTGCVEIKGKSVLEDSKTFYQPLFDWLSIYKTNPKEFTEVNIQLEYFNTASSKCLTDLLKQIDEIYRSGNKIVLNWYYDDEDICETGEDYQSFLKIPFKMIESPDLGFSLQ